MSDSVVDGVLAMSFPAVWAAGSGWLGHLFVVRQPGVMVEVGRDEAVANLGEAHDRAVLSLGFRAGDLALAEQVHGARVARIERGGVTVGGVDALISARPGCLLGIYVADCCAVYVVDPVRRAIGLAHAGRRGGEAGIVGQTIGLMEREFGSVARDLVVQLSPCIRPPRYEVDVAGLVGRDALAAGVLPGRIHDCGLCTGSDLSRFYSYRVERGRTGRMLALLGLVAGECSEQTSDDRS